MNKNISDDALLRQATLTAHDYLVDAVHYIDKEFGEGYSKEHPELVAAFMSIASEDFINATYIKYFSEER